MKLLVLDASSQLGAALADMAGQRDDMEFEFLPAAALRAPFDELRQSVAKFKPDFLINTHTMGYAEASAAVDAAHFRYIDFLAGLVANTAMGLVHISSAQVFAQAHGRRYSEIDPAEPDTAVGHDFLKVESNLIATVDRLLVLRSSWLFGLDGDGTFTRFLRLLEDGGQFPLYLQEEGAPTPAVDLARVVIAALQQLFWGAPCWGVYHYCSSDVANSREFAETVITQASHYGKVVPTRVSLVDEHDLDSRDVPHHPVLDCNKIKDCFGIKQRPWRSALTTMIKQFYQRETAGEVEHG